MRDIGSEIDITLRHLKNEIYDLIDKIEFLENDIGILEEEARLATLEDTNANDIGKLKDKISEQDSEIGNLEAQLATLDDANANNIDENDDLKAKIDDLYMKLDSKEDYIASLEEDLEKLQ